MLNVNVSGVELQKGGVEYLNAQLAQQNIKFQLIGKDECDGIESIIYQKKVCIFISFFPHAQVRKRKYFEQLENEVIKLIFKCFHTLFFGVS